MAERGKKEPLTEQEKKMAALKEAMSRIEKTFGKGSVMKLRENAKMEVDTFPSSSLSLEITDPHYCILKH